MPEMPYKPCAHIILAEASVFERKDRNTHSACEECVKMHPEGTWVHLRLCKACGKTLCCDSSPNRHMTHHASETGHVVAQSIEVGESWMFCYEDGLTIDNPVSVGPLQTQLPPEANTRHAT